MAPDPIRRFFEVALPLRISQDAYRFFTQEGQIAFSVREAGSWTLRFASEDPILGRFDRKARLQLWFSREAFLGFIEGTLDIPSALSTGAIKARGDLSLLEALGRLLEPEPSSLGWQTL